MNKCIRKSSIETSIRELEEMKDRDYTVISNYIKDVKEDYSIYKNRKNLFGFLRIFQILGGFAITTLTTYNNPYFKDNTELINIIVWYVSISNNIISLVVEKLNGINLADERLKIKLLITEGIKYDESSENYSFYSEDMKDKKMIYFKKACKSINENSVFGFLTRSETEPPEHIGFIHESKQKRIKNLWRESTPEKKNIIHPEEGIIDVNEG
tara:strand:+ start:12255 stop:12890 length:636 start_codon:yes stop_codon:yes gene_type:complete